MNHSWPQLTPEGRHDCWHPNRRSWGLGLLLLRFQHSASEWGMKPSGLQWAFVLKQTFVSHTIDCPLCEMQADHCGVHGPSCRSSQGRVPQNTALNDIVQCCVLSPANVPSTLEPRGLCWSDGKGLPWAKAVPLFGMCRVGTPSPHPTF